MELSEISVGDELMLANGAQAEPVLSARWANAVSTPPTTSGATWWSPSHSGFPGRIAFER